MASKLINIPMASTLNKSANRELLGAFTGFNLMQGHPEQDSGVYPYYKKQLDTSGNIVIDKKGNTWSEKDGKILKNDVDTGITVNLDKSYYDEEVEPYRKGKWYKIEIKGDYVVYVNNTGIWVDYYLPSSGRTFLSDAPSMSWELFNEKTSIDLSYDPITVLCFDTLYVMFKDENGRWYLGVTSGGHRKLLAFSKAASKTLSKRPQGRLNVFWDAFTIAGCYNSSTDTLVAVPVDTSADAKRGTGSLESISNRDVYVFKVDVDNETIYKWNGSVDDAKSIVGKVYTHELDTAWQSNDLTSPNALMPINRRMYVFNYGDGHAYDEFLKWSHNRDSNISAATSSEDVNYVSSNLQAPDNYVRLSDFTAMDATYTETVYDTAVSSAEYDLKYFINIGNDYVYNLLTGATFYRLDWDSDQNLPAGSTSKKRKDEYKKCSIENLIDWGFKLKTGSTTEYVIKAEKTASFSYWYDDEEYIRQNITYINKNENGTYTGGDDTGWYTFTPGIKETFEVTYYSYGSNDRILINPGCVERWIYMMKGTAQSGKTWGYWDIDKTRAVYHSSVITKESETRGNVGIHWYGNEYNRYDGTVVNTEFTDRWLIMADNWNTNQKYTYNNYCIDWSQDYPLITKYNMKDSTMNRWPYINSSATNTDDADNRYQSTKYLPLGNSGFYYGIQTTNSYSTVAMNSSSDSRSNNYQCLLDYSLYGNISGNTTYSTANLGTPISSIVYAGNNQYQGTLAEPLYSIDYNEIVPSVHNNDVYYKSTNGKYVKLCAKKLEDVNLFSYARQRYILVNTTDFYNCIDTEENRLTHYGWRYELPNVALTYNKDDVGGEYYPTYEVHTWGVGKNPYFTVDSNAIERSSFPVTNSSAYAISAHYLGDLGHVRFCPASYIDGIKKQDNEVQFSVGKSSGDTPTYKYTQPYRVAYEYYDNNLADTSAGHGLLGYKEPKYIDMVTASSSGLYRCLTPGNTIKNYDGNTSIVRAGGYYYYMSTSDGKLMTVYNTDTQVQDFNSMFFIQSSVYGVYDKYIYLLSWSSGDVSISTPICEVADMQFIGNSTEFAYFYSKQDKAIYYFDGTRKLKYFSNCSYWNSIGVAKYNLYDGMIYLPTDKGLYIFQQNIESFLENIGNENSTITVTAQGVVVDDVMIKKYKTDEEDEVIPVKIETKMYSDPNYTQVQCSEWLIRLVEPSGIVKASTDVLTDKLVIGDTKEYECKDKMIRFKPKLQTGSGVRLKLETESPIFMISVQADAHGVQISKSSM